MIRSEKLTKSFGERQVLRGIDLWVPEGQVFGFVGPNGAGKSTFIKCLLGIVRPDGGKATIAGLDARRASLEVRRKVGYAPGEIALYNRMKVRDLLRFAVAFHAAKDLPWAHEQLEHFGVPLDRKIGKLSHGMKRKVLLVSALCVDTPLIILDEPMEGLDPEARLQVEALLRTMVDRGRTVFFSSHDLASVERVCDQVAFLRQGVLLESGPVQTLMDRASHVLHLTFSEPRAQGSLPQEPGWQWSGDACQWRLEFQEELRSVLPKLSSLPLASLRDSSGRLEDVFEALYGHGDEGGTP